MPASITTKAASKLFQVPRDRLRARLRLHGVRPCGKVRRRGPGQPPRLYPLRAVWLAAAAEGSPVLMRATPPATMSHER